MLAESMNAHHRQMVHSTSMNNMCMQPIHICCQCYNALHKGQLAIKAGNTTIFSSIGDNCRVNKYTKIQYTYIYIYVHCRFALTSQRPKQA